MLRASSIASLTWATETVGKIYVHANGRPAFDSLVNRLTTGQLDAVAKITWKTPEKLISAIKNSLTSKIIGEVDIVDCVLNHSGVWSAHKALITHKVVEVEVPVYNWVLANPMLHEQPILQHVKAASSLVKSEWLFEVVGNGKGSPPSPKRLFFKISMIINFIT
ncbi:hypothetical protein [Pedobacter agri]|uniref:hypothetical protein n=1 Tax=Pedobacter agri TaxID=454586 RepID=UPI00292DF71D|nr:hypothetical protein [Pedobacter agri]